MSKYYFFERMASMKFITRKTLIWVGIIVIAISLVLVGGCGKKAAPKPLPEGNKVQNQGNVPNGNVIMSRIVMGYYENPWPGNPDEIGSFPSLKEFGKYMSTVSPYWYKATATGDIDSKESKLVYDAAKGMKIKIIPLITNIREATDDILAKPEVRSALANNIAKLVKDKDYDGINIDFEMLDPAHKDNLTAFMAELYPKMVSLNKTLIISVFPKVDVHESVHGAYDYAELARYADYLQIMTYDRHWSTSDPGPIAPINWYEANVKYAVETCGPEKILVGVGVYGYDWVNKKGETVTYVDAITLADKNGIGVRFDEESRSPYFSYGNGHEVWFENAQSISAKLDVIQKYNPAGIAIWRLGQEQPEVWETINRKFPKGQGFMNNNAKNAIKNAASAEKGQVDSKPKGGFFSNFFGR